MASTAAERLEDLNLTHEEVEKLTEAFKKDEFRKLFLEYAEEISNPENKARYESEIRQMENERGMDVKFINPEAGYVIKTTVGGNMKAFINICKNEYIEKPSSVKQTGSDGRQGLFWSLPHSFSPPREDISKTKEKCQVYDVVFHPDTYRMAETNSRFKKMVNDTALEGISKQFSVELDLKNLKFPKIKYKGMPTPTVIRTRLPENAVPKKEKNGDSILNQFPYPYNTQTSEEKAMQKLKDMEQKQAVKEKSQHKTKDTKQIVRIEEEYAVPKYCIRHQSEIDMQDFVDSPNVRSTTRPKALVIDVFLPLLSSAAPIQLDILEKQMKLVSDNPVKYKLTLDLPYPVDESKGSAKFDKVRRKLVVTLPVLLSIKVDFWSGDEVANSPSSHDLDHLTDSTEIGGSMNCSDRDDSDNHKPLIEVISSHDTEKRSEADKIVYGDETTMPETTRDTLTQSGDTVRPQNADTNVSPLIYNSLTECMLPKFECQQDLGTITFDFHVNHVKHEFTSLTILSTHSCQLKMISIGDGGYPVYYCCVVKFNEECHAVGNGWSVMSSVNKVTMTVVKEESSKGIWNAYWIGTELDCLEEQHNVQPSTLDPSEKMDSFEKINSVAPKKIPTDVIDIQSSSEDVMVELVGQTSDPIITVVESNVDRSVEHTSADSERSVPLSNVDESDRKQELELMNSLRLNTQLNNFQVEDLVSVHTESKKVQESQSSEQTEVMAVTDNEYDVTSDSKCDVIEDQHEHVRKSDNETEARNQKPSADESAPGPETMLSWKDVVRDSVAESRCAVSFNNNVIFDLDVE